MYIEIKLSTWGNTTLVDWANSSANNSVAMLIIPQSALGTVTQASGIDPVATATTLLAISHAANPFGRSLNVLSNTNVAKTNPFLLALENEKVNANNFAEIVV